ncbi:MAG: T9SS type A sorting domain-containing protein [Bacteroidales bacterium]|nr:T9SS type A sorting domain-containing protein [Candidatus Colimorpha onthohippi]
MRINRFLFFTFLLSVSMAGWSRGWVKNQTFDIVYDTVRVYACQGYAYSGYGFEFTRAEMLYVGTVKERTRVITGDETPDTSLTIVVTVSSNPRIRIKGNTAVCQGGSEVLRAQGGIRYEWSNGSQNDDITVCLPGQVKLKGYNEFGCWSMDSVEITINAPLLNEETRHLCQGDTTYFYGEALFESCRRLYWEKTPEGCDSQSVLYVEVHPLPQVRISGDTHVCDNQDCRLVASGADIYRWFDGVMGSVYEPHQSGEYSVQGITTHGCKSSASVEVSYYETKHTFLSDSICQGSSVSFYRRELRYTGDYVHVDTSADGCDSVVTMSLTVSEPSMSEFRAYATDRYGWNDTVYTESGKYRQTLTNMNGCDSFVTIYLTIVHQQPLPRIISNQQRLLMVDHYPGGEDSDRVDYIGYRWVCNNQWIEGATSDSYHAEGYPILKGCYWVEVQTDSVSWVPSNKICINFDINDLGIDEANQNMSIQVMPMPAKSGQAVRLRIGAATSSLLEGAQVVLYDLEGRAHLRQSVMGAEVVIEAPTHSGLYLLQVRTASGQTATQRLLVHE